MLSSNLSKAAISALRDILSVLGGVHLSKMIPMAIGYVVSVTLTLPTGPIADLKSYFKLQFQVEVDALLGMLNELAPMDIDAAREAVFSFYSYRVYAASPAIVPVLWSKETALVAFFGINRFFSNEQLEAITTSPPEMISLLKNYSDIVQSLREQMNPQSSASEPSGIMLPN